MEAKVNKQSEFLEIVSNFNFDIIFHDEKYPKGRYSFDPSHGGWGFNQSDDYWDFDILINGYKIENLLTNWKNIKYSVFLDKQFINFVNNHDSSNLLSISKADCYDLLINELELLSHLNTSFYDEEIPDESYPNITYKIQLHRKVEVAYSDLSKVFKPNGDGLDYFLYTCISSFVSRQKEVIESAISFLNKKLQWLNLRKEQTRDANEADTKFIDIKWCKSDTALLELVTALMEIKAINNSQNNLTRKEAIETFSKIFGIEIKDAESKLSRATERKRDISFPTALKESFDNYVIRKEQK